MSTSVRCKVVDAHIAGDRQAARAWRGAPAATPAALDSRGTGAPGRRWRAPARRWCAAQSVSAMAGTPDSPSRVARAPGGNAMPSQRPADATRPSSRRWRRTAVARCSTWYRARPRRPGKSPMQPASVSSAFPSGPGPPAVVSAPSGKSRQRLSLRARNLSISTRPGSSSTGRCRAGRRGSSRPPRRRRPTRFQACLRARGPARAGARPGRRSLAPRPAPGIDRAVGGETLGRARTR
jgi:hypothetical protein